MFKMSEYAFVAAILATGLALILYLGYALSGLRAARMQTAGATVRTGVMGFSSGPRTAGLGRYATILGWLGFAFLTAWVIFRTLATGHGPFANMYEFSVAFAWGILGAYYWFEHSYHQRILALFALPVALAMMLYATTISSVVEPLVPALQNNLLLTVHVAVAIVAYGSFTIAFAAALLFIIQPEGGRWGLPKPEILDDISYKAVVVGFPFLTAVIVLGAVWAETAWGRYWSWDPKETASLVTWLIYGAYLHARVVRNWRGRKAAYLLMLGFAATLFTYFGNLFFGGLHSYSGLG
ncbi:MAG: c-type cytochrome biogenesis protein CcsB [Chloroflexi bacterium RBG_16_69_14]|nr:MAG: c-type cytochrome biogenesis protein CcsB [Chloroflexi bacterium RBG_16_69_14]